MLTLLTAMAWGQDEIDPKRFTDFTAYTVPKKHWRLGPLNADYGLLRNASLGTSPWGFLLGVGNVHAKVTAIQTPKFDASGDVGFYGTRREDGEVDLQLRVSQMGWSGSWTPHPKWGIHFGNGFFIGHAEGTMPLQAVGESVSGELEQALGVGLGGSIDEAALAELLELSGESQVAVRGNITVQSFRWSVAHQWNPHNAVILRSETYVSAWGNVGAGVERKDGLGGGAVVYFGPIALDEHIASVTSLSWQRSWERFHLRVGLPLPGSAFWLAVPQAFELYWVLGPQGATRAETG